MKHSFLIFAVAGMMVIPASAQERAGNPEGGISSEMIERIRTSWKATPSDKALKNALAGTSIATLAINSDNAAMIGAAAYHEYLAGNFAAYDLNAVPNLKLGER